MLQYDPASHVALLSMERHARKNAIGRQFLSDMAASIRVCTASPPALAGGAAAVDVRCLVVSSAVAGVFCAGADLKERREMTAAESRCFVQALRQTFNDLEDLPIPTIAAVEGRALGGGLELALALDLRVAGADAVFGFPETGLAILPGAGGTVRAPALVGTSRALELILTAEPVGAARAAALGLVNRQVEAGAALSTALQIAKRVSQNGPVGVRAAKAAVRGGAGKARDEAMRVEEAQYEVVLASEDRLEGLKAFAEKRPPVYRGC